jgi:hypothetical protein
MDNITWHWSENPIGFPTDPDDTEFKSPRTPPSASLAISYKRGDVHLRQGVTMSDRTIKTLSDDDKESMKNLLMKWLDDRLFG